MTASGRDVGEVAAAFRRFALEECRGYCPLYEAVAARVAEEPALLALGARARPGQPPPNLLFASVRLLLLRGTRHALAEHYARAAEPGGGAGADAAWPAFRDFCLEHAAEIGESIASHRVQTNEVGRCVFLRAGLVAGLAGTGARRIALVDVGSSAGLNLLPDRYAYRYVPRSGRPVEIGSPESGVLLACEMRGDRVPPTGPLPEIVARRGIDLDPPDLADDADVLWLRALVWPDQPARERRLLAAIALAREVRPRIATGNAADLLPSVLASLPEDAVACVTHSSVWHQIGAADRARIDDAVAQAARARPLLRVGAESTDGHVSELRVTRPGEREPRVLARAHPHGGWMEWLGT